MSTNQRQTKNLQNKTVFVDNKQTHRHLISQEQTNKINLKSYKFQVEEKL